MGTVYREKGDYSCKNLEMGTAYREKGDYPCINLEIGMVYSHLFTRCFSDLAGAALESSTEPHFCQANKSFEPGNRWSVWVIRRARE